MRCHRRRRPARRCQHLSYCSIVLLSSICKRITSSCRMTACSLPVVVWRSSAAQTRLGARPHARTPARGPTRDLPYHCRRTWRHRDAQPPRLHTDLRRSAGTCSAPSRTWPFSGTQERGWEAQGRGGEGPGQQLSAAGCGPAAHSRSECSRDRRRTDSAKSRHLPRRCGIRCSRPWSLRPPRPAPPAACRPAADEQRTKRELFFLKN